MRLKAELWVEAFVRRCQRHSQGIYVVRRGDSDAGEILIKFDRLNGDFQLLAPAIGSAHRDDGSRVWRKLSGECSVPEKAVDELIGQRASFDPDLWVLAVETVTGWAGLEHDIEIDDQSKRP